MAAFETVYEKYAQQVYRFLLTLTRDEQKADELTQETFYRAFLHIGRFDGRCSLYTWLCRIAHNAYITDCRRHKSLPIEEETVRSDGGELIDELSDKEQALRIHKALHRLPEPYREVFSLKVFGELKFREIAEVCGKTESWAKVTYYRAKQKIVEEMEESI